MTMAPLTITPIAVDTELPDVDSNVLLFLADGHSCEGFLDADDEGNPLWRDVCADPLPAGHVTHWAGMPQRSGGWTC